MSIITKITLDCFFSNCCLNYRHGSQSLTISRVVPDIVKLLSDPTATVRDTAFNTLVDIYKHIGEKLRIDLQRRNLVPQSKWPTLSARFDEVRDSGELLNSAKYSDAGLLIFLFMCVLFC